MTDFTLIFSSFLKMTVTVNCLSYWFWVTITYIKVLFFVSSQTSSIPYFLKLIHKGKNWCKLWIHFLLSWYLLHHTIQQTLIRLIHDTYTGTTWKAGWIKQVQLTHFNDSLLFIMAEFRAGMCKPFFKILALKLWYSLKIVFDSFTNVPRIWISRQLLLSTMVSDLDYWHSTKYFRTYFIDLFKCCTKNFKFTSIIMYQTYSVHISAPC